MGVVDDIAAWLGFDASLTGWAIGIGVILALVALSYLMDEKGRAVPFVLFVGIVFVILIGLWPLWVALLLVIAGAAYLMFSPSFGAGRGD